MAFSFLPVPENDFYTKLPVFEHFVGLTEPGSSGFVPAPDDWVLAVADVEGSTKAVAAGFYKEVNLVNASAILALLNICGFDRVPFVFGGDGATALIPPEHAEAVHAALVAARTMAKEEFDLALRVGMLPVSAIRRMGRDLQVAKVRISPHFNQAAFAGGGTALAEKLLKRVPLHPKFCREPAVAAGRELFNGLECRWERIRSSREEIVAILVQATADDSAGQNRLYREVLGRIEGIYGPPGESRPVTPEGIRLPVDRQNLRGEHRVRSFGKGRIYRLWYHLEVRLMTLTGMVFMKTGVRAVGANWGDYKGIAASNTDFRKFDDQVKQVLSGTVAQRLELTSWLEEKRLGGDLYYGIHASPNAIITCLISDYHTRHFHLVDGADGGYTLASRQLKQQVGEKSVSAKISYQS